MKNFDITMLDQHQISTIPTSTYNLNKDLNGIFTLIKYINKDGFLYKDVSLFGGTSPYYTDKKIRIYDVDGETILYQYWFKLFYYEGLLISEILQ